MGAHANYRHLMHYRTTVSYTHLDVYKRQVQSKVVNAREVIMIVRPYQYSEVELKIEDSNIVL